MRLEKLSGWNEKLRYSSYTKCFLTLNFSDSFLLPKKVAIFKKFLYLPVQFILHSQKLLWDQSGCQMLLLTQVERASESSSLPQQSWSMSKSFFANLLFGFCCEHALKWFWHCVDILFKICTSFAVISCQEFWNLEKWNFRFPNLLWVKYWFPI